MTKKWERRYWIYLVLVLFWLVEGVTKTQHLNGPILIGIIIDWLVNSTIIIVIIEAVYRKIVRKKKNSKDKK